MGYQGEITLQPLAAIVSLVAGRKIEVSWGKEAQMRGHWGHANYETIRLHWLLGANMDKRAPFIFWHEVGHVLLPTGDKSDGHREIEANDFAERMMQRGGAKLFWDLVTMFNELNAVEANDLSEFLECITNAAPIPGARKEGPKLKSNTQHRSAPRETKTAAQWEEQARREEELAARVQTANPTLAAMIRNSAIGKTEHASAIRGQPVSATKSRYETRPERLVTNVNHISISKG